MIFVTVGTHEQPFNRLVEYIDNLKRDGIIKDDIMIQTGFSTYEPQYCSWSKLLPYQDMIKYVEKADLVITHGGPSSFIMPLQVGKIPIVVPRYERYGEHVNDHQVEFAKAVAERQKNILVVEEVDELKELILNYKTITESMSGGLNSNNKVFNEKFEKLVEGLFK